MSASRSLKLSLVQLLYLIFRHSRSNKVVLNEAVYKEKEDGSKRSQGHKQQGPVLLSNFTTLIADAMNLVCELLLPLSVVDAQYPSLLKTQSKLLAMHDLVAAASLKPPPIVGAALVSASRGVLDATLLATPGDGHCCYHFLAVFLKFVRLHRLWEWLFGWKTFALPIPVLPLRSSGTCRPTRLL